MTVMSKYGMGTMYRRGSAWWVQYYWDGQRIRESAKTTEEKVARQFLKRRLGEAVTGAHAGMGAERARISDVLALLLESYRDNERHSTVTVAGVVKNYLDPILGKLKCSQFSSADITRYIKRRQSAIPKPANGTINRELAALRHALKLGMEQHPPLVARAVKVTLLKEAEARQGFIDQEQYRALCLCLPEYLRPITAAAFYLGCRAGELRSMKWSQVDFARGIITIHANQAKSGRHRELPIYGELWNILKVESEAAKAYPKCPWVFHRQGNPVGDFRKAWGTAGKLSGVAILFHDLRRSAARNMEMGGMLRESAKKITGHLTDSMYQRYAGVTSTKDMVDAGKTMERFFESQQPIEKRLKIN